MVYIESPSMDAYFNMAFEEYVFNMPKSEEYFLLWQNANAVVVGRYQNTAGEINAEYVREKGIQVVRRLSGGGAMYQDGGNLNFTFIVDQKKSRSLDFGIFIQPVVKALAQIGVHAEQNSRNDITIGGRKFSGNSQYNKHGRTMHHGTLLFDSDLGVVGDALRVKADKIEGKGIKSVRSRVTNILPHLPQSISMGEFKQVLLREMFEANELTQHNLTEADLAAIDKLRQEKYSTWEWNFGKNPPCNILRERRYAFGGVAAAISAKHDIIECISITGDFFGNGDIAELTNLLTGCPLQADGINAALADTDVSHYIQGMTAEQLCELILLG